MESQLKETGNELKSFRKGKNIYDIEEGAKFSDKMLEFDVSRDEITQNNILQLFKDLSKKTASITLNFQRHQ
jgi:hypothetical protein